MASPFGQYTSGINPVQGIAQTGSVIAEMQLKAWDTVGKQFSTAIEEYAKQESYRKMQESIANSASTKDSSEIIKGYADKIDVNKDVGKFVEDSLIDYKKSMKDMAEIAGKQGGRVNVVDDDTFRSMLLKSSKAVIQNRKDIHPDLQFALDKQIGIEMDKNSVLPEDDVIAGEKLMEEDYYSKVAPSETAKALAKYAGKDNMGDTTELEASLASEKTRLEELKKIKEEGDYTPDNLIKKGIQLASDVGTDVTQ